MLHKSFELNNLEVLKHACATQDPHAILNCLGVTLSAISSTWDIWNCVLNTAVAHPQEECILILLESDFVVQQFTNLKLNKYDQTDLLAGLLHRDKLKTIDRLLDLSFLSKFQNILLLLEKDFDLALKALSFQDVRAACRFRDDEVIGHFLCKDQLEVFSILFKDNLFIRQLCFERLLLCESNKFDDFMCEWASESNFINEAHLSYLLRNKRVPAFPKKLIDALFQNCKEKLNTYCAQENGLLGLYIKENNKNIDILESMKRHGYDFVSHHKVLLPLAFRAKNYLAVKFILRHNPGEINTAACAKTRRLVLEQAPSKEVGSEQFDAVVSQFMADYKSNHLAELLFSTKGTIELLNGEPAITCSVKELFFSHPVIKQYLLRSSCGVEYGKEQPCYSSIYEAELYDLFAIPLRKGGSNFLEDGLTVYPIDKLLSELIATLNVESTPHILFMPYAHDRSELKRALEDCIESDKTCTNPQGFTFMLHALRSPGHIQCALSVIDYKRKAIPLFLCIESGSSRLFDASSLRSFGYVARDRDICIYPFRETEFVQIPLWLQLDEEDGNCSFYTAEVMKALYVLLPETEHMLPDLEKWRAAITHNFRKYLPDFYSYSEEGYSLKTWEALKPFFLQKRWQVGTRALKSIVEHSSIDQRLAPLLETVSEVESENSETELSISEDCISSTPDTNMVINGTKRRKLNY